MQQTIINSFIYYNSVNYYLNTIYYLILLLNEIVIIKCKYKIICPDVFCLNMKLVNL